MKRMNEKEMLISLKAIRLAWLYSIVFLFIWIIFDFIKLGSFNDNPAFLLLITQNIILLLSQFYLKGKTNK